MLDFLKKSPKALLSSAIATALAEFFVVDVDHIESNLLTDTKIVLTNVQLKPQRSSIRTNTFGKTTNICVTGVVREVSFTWLWESVTSSSKSWVKDAVLQITGCKIRAQLTQDIISDDDDDDACGDDATIDRSSDEEQKCSTRLVPSIVEKDTEQKIANEGGMYAYIKKQVEMIVGGLTLTIVGFELTVEMPSPIVAQGLSSIVDIPRDAAAAAAEGTSEIVELEPSAIIGDENNTNDRGGNDDNCYTVSFVIGGSDITITSRHRSDSDNDEMLKENISFSSLYLNVIETFHKTTTTTTTTTTNESNPRRCLVQNTYPLQEPFSYNMEVTRTHGKRFSGMGRGLIVTGRQLQESDTKDSTVHLSFHLARPQIEGFGQLSGLLLAPRDDDKGRAETVTETITHSDTTNDGLGNFSTFDFSIDGAIVDVMGDIVAVTGVNAHYMADGTNLTVGVDVFRYDAALPTTKDHQPRGTSIICSDIVASMRPSVEVTIGSVDTIYVPGVVELRTPMGNVRARLIGEAWVLHIESFDGLLLSLEIELGEETVTTNSNPFMIPYQVSCNFKRIRLVNDNDESNETEVILTDFEILMNPNPRESSTDLACSVKCLESKLVRASNIHTCMAIPVVVAADTTTIRNFALSLDNMSVTAGYSVQDWTKTFGIGGGKWKRTEHKSLTTNNNNEQTNYPNIPFASVAPLKMKISYNAMNVMSVKETTFLVKAYKGKEDTNLKHLIDFYVAECLFRTPNFLQNAELLGINVEDAGAFSLGAALGFAGPIGPFLGVAAVVGVDAVRGSIEAGMRSRDAKDGDAANIQDFFRGIGYSAVEATQEGKLRRGGCKDGRHGNIFDFMIGATVNTGDYLGKNKDTIGSAGGAGAGVLVGTLLGGPIGAVIGGVVGGMTTGTAIRKIDKRIKMSKEKEESEKEKS